MPRWFAGHDEVPCLRDLARALRLGRRLALGYRRDTGRGPETGEPGERGEGRPGDGQPRVVGPLGLVNKAGTWYLVAVRADAAGAPAFRVFRADRVTSARVLAEPFERPPGFELAAFWRQWSADFEASRPRLQVALRASPAALAAFPEIFGQAAEPALEAALPPDEHGWRVVTLSFEHERAAAHRLAGFGDHVEVLAPPAVRAALVTTARQILRRYDDGMADGTRAERDGRGPEIIELSSVPGFVVFDMPGVAMSAGGTRLAPDVSVAEVAMLARAMTYKYAVLGVRVGGAKAGVRGDPADRAARAALMARFCAEIAPLADSGRLLTGPDMGTTEEDFAPLRQARAAPMAISAVVDGLPFEDLLTGYGVAVAAEAALRAGDGGNKGWDGRSVAIEGFGKVGGGVAREVTRRGGRVVAVSTLAGCVADRWGLDVELLLTLRRTHGDACVLHYGRPAGPPADLFTAVAADVIVPGTRPGVMDAQTAGSLPAGVLVVAPAANVAYTAQGADVLHQRGIVALPDFVCNSGAVLGYRATADATPDQVLADVEATITGLILDLMDHPGSPLTAARERAGTFLRGWWGEPPDPPFAPER
jgi:glutamate dehydrogenase (NAD(P)+)